MTRGRDVAIKEKVVNHTIVLVLQLKSPSFSEHNYYTGTGNYSIRIPEILNQI